MNNIYDVVRSDAEIEQDWKRTIESGKKFAIESLELDIKDYGAGGTEGKKGLRAGISKGIEILEKTSLKPKRKKEFESAKALFKMMEAKDQQSAVAVINASKKKKGKVKLLKALIQQPAYPEKREAIDKTVADLQKSTLKPDTKKKLDEAVKLDTAVEQLKADKAKGVPAVAAAHPALFTAKILNPKTTKRLHEIAKEWHAKAKFKKDLSNAAEAQVAKDKRELADDSNMLAGWFEKDMKDLKPTKRKDAVYIAYDSAMKVQAMVCASLSKKETQEIDILATNPDNVVVFGTEQSMVRGAGTAIITHIAHEVLQNKKFKKKKLGLVATETAEPFYKKLGFKENKEGDFVLKKSKMEELFRNKAATHTILDVEPKPELLK